MKPTLLAASLLTLSIGFAVVPLQGQQGPPARVSFTQAQVEAGRAIYMQSCSACHGERLRDSLAPPLIGAEFFKSWGSPRSLDDLFFTLRTTMPKNAGAR